MKSDVEEFLVEMDKLTKEGIFGEKPKLYAFLKDKIERNTFFMKVYLDWLKDNKQVGKDRVLSIIELLIKLYYDVLKSKPEKVIEILGYFNGGFPEIPESDLAKPLYTWFESLNNWRDSLPTGNQPGSPMQIAQNSITVYQKGIEYCNKILAIFLCLQYENVNQEYNSKKIYKKSLYNKSTEYSEIFEEDYYFIINLIDRDIRNAESHLDLRYDRFRNKIIYLVRKREGTQKKYIPMNKFMYAYFPNPGHIIQGYIFSLMLFITIGSSHISELNHMKKTIQKRQPE